MVAAAGIKQSRRSFLHSSGVLAGSVAMPWVSRVHAQSSEGQVVFAFLGGSTETLFQKIIIPKFTSETGIRIQFVAGTPTDTVAKLRASRGNSGIDVCQLAGPAAYEAIDKGLVQPVDPALVPNITNLDPRIPRDPPILPLSVASICLIYNKQVYDSKGWAPPASWFDLWDPRLAGHTGMYDMNSTGGVALLLQIAKDLTGDYTRLDAAFPKFKELRKTIYQFFTSAGAWETAMQEGDLWLAQNGTTRAMQLSKAGWPIGVVLPKSGVASYQVSLGLVSGAPHPKAAQMWLNYLLSKDVQQLVVEQVGYAPSVKGAVIPPDVAAYFPVGDQAWYPDWRKVNSQFNKIVERWEREVEG